jgi:hypothetical protein
MSPLCPSVGPQAQSTTAVASDAAVLAVLDTGVAAVVDPPPWSLGSLDLPPRRSTGMDPLPGSSAGLDPSPRSSAGLDSPPGCADGMDPPPGSSDAAAASGSGRKKEVAPLAGGGSATSRRFLRDTAAGEGGCAPEPLRHRHWRRGPGTARRRR